MKCNAMMFNLEKRLNKDKTRTNNFLTFVDTDTGESFTTWVSDEIAAQYKPRKESVVHLSISVGEFQGRPQLNTRIISIENPSMPSMRSAA